MGYSESTSRSISSLTELRPGDHIQVPSSNLKYGRLITHHLLVAGVIDEKCIRVIHKVPAKGVVEEKKCYSPEDVTVLDYDSEHTGQAAIDRARERIGEKYNLALGNCEHFLTEVRTGVKQSIQVRGGVAGGAAGAGGGVLVGAGAGVGAGAVAGAVIGLFFFPVVGPLFGGGVGAVIGVISGGAIIGAGGGGAGIAVGIKIANVLKRRKKKN